MSKSTQMSKRKMAKADAAVEPVVELDEMQLDEVRGGRKSGGSAGKSSFSDISFTTSANKASPH